MSILRLPTELIFLVAEGLDKTRDINHLLLANRRLCSVLTPLLHKRAVNLDDEEGRTALQWAVRRDHEPLVRLLLHHGYNVNQRYPASRYGNLTVLYLTARFATRVAILKLLLEAGASINVRVRDGETVLHPAVRYGKVEFVKLLLDYGVNISVRRFDGDTALHIAARYRYEDIVKLLVEAGANVTTENYCGQTPLERVGPVTHGTE